MPFTSANEPAVVLKRDDAAPFTLYSAAARLLPPESLRLAESVTVVLTATGLGLAVTPSISTGPAKIVLVIIVRARRTRAFFEQTFEPPLQHLTHHSVIVAWCEIRRPDVEFSVLVLAKPFRAGDDHGAYRIAAADGLLS